MKIRHVFILIAISIFGLALVLLYLFKKSEISVASKKADLEIDASKLLREFETDENAANTLFLNKIIIVTGTVESVSEDSVGITVYLKDKEAVSGVICSFNKKAIDPKMLKKGNRTKIKGICNGYLMDVILGKCSLIKESDIK